MSFTHPVRPISRRQLLQAAGGVTFSALLPTQKDAHAAASGQGKPVGIPPPLPIFTALPYLQPGTTSSKLVEGQEAIVVAWQTDGVSAAFDLEYGPGTNLGRKAEVGKQERLNANRDEGGQRFNHVASLTGLQLNRRYHYRVRMNGVPLLEGYFTTRKPRGVKTRFVAFGDNSCGEISDHAIAYYAYRARPDFVMNTGDNVYNNGLDSEYEHYFFPVYNADVAGPHIGSPLLRAVPYYSVIANHDLTGNDPRHRPVVDFSRHADGGAYYTNWHFPLNGPTPTYPTLAVGDAGAVAQFKTCAGSRYPNMANYSYDYGDAHFLCLDANVYVDPTDAALQAWIAKDLDASDAAWKFVVYHHPAFNVGAEHYSEQHMRVLSPLFEQHHVDVVLSGHEHNYQRTRPLRFAPSNDAGAKHVNSGDRLVPGKFTVDNKFDGKTVTRPDGILYIVTGAGGNDLYDPHSNENPTNWRHTEDENAEYVARMISDRHSLTVVDMDAKSLLFTQIDEWGREIDRCHITKA
jgi:acid phosphatase type 7